MDLPPLNYIAAGLTRAQVVCVLEGTYCPELYETIEDKIKDVFPNKEEALAVARCESGLKQFDKRGEVIQNKESTAIGVFQIMASLHKKYANSLDLDIQTADGNIKFAKILYDKYGWKPWAASKKCSKMS